MPPTARCKFACQYVTDHGNGYKSVKLTAVYGGSEENRSFHEATPNGELAFSYANKNVFLQPGKEYYLDISEVQPAVDEQPQGGAIAGIPKES